MGGIKPKYDEQITKLFTEENIGAREIAKRLGFKHIATISKRLMRLGLRRPNTCVRELSSNNIEFKCDIEHLHRAAEDYLKFLCSYCGYYYAEASPELPYDLLVDFGDGWKKIQVKSSAFILKSGNAIFHIYKSKFNTKHASKELYTAQDIDYFFLFDSHKRAWLIPFSLLEGTKTCTPAYRYPGYELKLAPAGFEPASL